MEKQTQQSHKSWMKLYQISLGEVDQLKEILADGSLKQDLTILFLSRCSSMLSSNCGLLPKIIQAQWKIKIFEG